MLFKSTTAIVTAGFLFASAGAMAEGDRSKEYSSIDRLPEEGRVTITGTVDDVAGKTEFTLRDRDGETIDVDLNKRQVLKEGDRVKVVGMMDDDLAGIGQEINAIRVTEVDGYDRMSGHDTYSDEYAAADTTRDHKTKNDRRVAKSDFDTVDSLPDRGPVTISGTVEAVNMDDNSFTLRDSNGDLIDIRATERLTVREGQKVNVSGTMDHVTVGPDIGEQIVSADVTLQSQG